MKPIKTGDMIPEFSLPDQNGNLFDIKTVLGRKKLVIFFYPQDGSHGCTREACYFRDFSETFNEAEAVIVGISGQSAESHYDFAAKYNLNYPLLSDTGDKVRKLFGVPSSGFGLIPGRATYVANKDGRVIHVFNSQSQVKRHVDEALKVVLVLKKADNNNS